MAEYWALLNQMRHDLGKSFTVAHEHTMDGQRVNLLVLRRRRQAILVVATDTRWLASLLAGSDPVARVEYKHLTMLVHRYFVDPSVLPSGTFAWPGTPESRDELRRTLTGRR